MKIEINLKEPKYCDECPIMDGCYCFILGLKILGEKDKDEMDTGRLIRPQECIEKYGE